MMKNIAEYLSDYRMLNDYISVTSAEVIDLSVEMDLIIDPGYNQADIVTNIIDKTTTFFSPDNKEMGKDVFTGELTKDIVNQPGVINLVDLRMFNKVGGDYSENTVSPLESTSSNNIPEPCFKSKSVSSGSLYDI